MERQKPIKKKVTVSLTPQEHDHLSLLAEQAYRTRAGYLHWLLLRHFRERDRGAP